MDFLVCRFRVIVYRRLVRLKNSCNLTPQTVTFSSQKACQLTTQLNWALYKNGGIVKIELPYQELGNSFSLESALNQRETKREYLNTPISLTNLSRLLFAAQGRRGNGTKLLAPSAQEQYPLSTFVIANRINDIEAGLYQYENTSHSIVELEKGAFSERLEDAALGDQPWIGNAAAIVILAGNIHSMNKHFSKQPPLNMRGERYNYIEVGAVAQNMYLQGTALNIGMVLVGGFNNEKVKTILTLSQELEPAALLCIGNV
jgi:SagB-type dehydrogenase family enzyme